MGRVVVFVASAIADFIALFRKKSTRQLGQFKFLLIVT